VGEDIWNINSIYDAVDEYLEVLRNIASFCLNYPDRTFVVKYEDLLCDEENVLLTLGDFLGLSLCPSNLPLDNRSRISVLSNEERTYADHQIGALGEAWGDLTLTGPAATVLPSLSSQFASTNLSGVFWQAVDRSVLGFGWSGLEQDGVWSENSIASVIFRAARTGQVLVGLRLYVFNRCGTPLPAIISLNDQPIFEGEFLVGSFYDGVGKHTTVSITQSDQPVQLWLGPAQITAGRLNHLRFSFPNILPATAFGSEDPRALGIKLTQISILSLE
jgi:hypothetical protein